ncbi:MAG: precorrin-8X methylmutase, partial [Vulcanisaeta sp.]
VQSRVDVPVYLAHNEYVEPNWRSLLRELISRGFNRFVLALAFLGKGNHVVRDIMSSLGVSEFGKWVRVSYGGNEVEVYVTEPLSNSALFRVAFLRRIILALSNQDIAVNSIVNPGEIYEESFGEALKIVSSKYAEWPGWSRLIAASIIYATGNPGLLNSIYISDDFITAFQEALRSGLPILTDVNMVKVGIRWTKVENYLDHENTLELSRRLGITRAAAAMRVGLDKPKIVVIGNSPTALIEVLRLVREGIEVPAIIATPPGFTNAVEAKEGCIKSRVPCITVRGTYGGSNMAVAAANKAIEISVMGNG